MSNRQREIRSVIFVCEGDGRVKSRVRRVIRQSDDLYLFQYLALHSPVFHKLFYGRKSKLGARFELDHDPRTFGDILDMIYPCYKKTSC